MFLTSRMRAFNNSSDNSLYLYLKVNLSHFSDTWLVKLGMTVQLIPNSVLQTCFRAAEAREFILMLETDGN